MLLPLQGVNAMAIRNPGCRFLPWAMRLLGFQPALPINVLGIASLALGWSLLPFRACPCISL